MQNNHPLLFAIFLAVIIFWTSTSFADVRKTSFRKNGSSRQLASFGGNYESDQNSKSYKISGAYAYKNNKFLHEVEFLHDVDYAETATIAMRKTKELYDGEISSKMRILKTDNYLNFYNRSKYDEFSRYYYDVTTSAGVGRIFFDDKMEIDFNIGWNQIKNSNSEAIINPTLKMVFNITDRIKFTTKGYLFKGETTETTQLKSRLSFRLDRNFSFEIVHNFEKDRYIHITKKIRERRNEASRSYVARITYNF